MSIYKQIYKAAQKFFSESESDVTIVLHSNAILTYYSPKSITALTLFADKFDNKPKKNINFEEELLT